MRREFVARRSRTPSRPALAGPSGSSPQVPLRRVDAELSEGAGTSPSGGQGCPKPASSIRRGACPPPRIGWVEEER